MVLIPAPSEVGHWIVSGDSVHLCDENGAKTGNSRPLPEGGDPRNIAVALLRGKIGRRSTDFSRPLRYPTMRF